MFNACTNMLQECTDIHLNLKHTDEKFYSKCKFSDEEIKKLEEKVIYAKKLKVLATSLKVVVGVIAVATFVLTSPIAAPALVGTAVMHAAASSGLVLVLGMVSAGLELAEFYLERKADQVITGRWEPLTVKD